MSGGRDIRKENVSFTSVSTPMRLLKLLPLFFLLIPLAHALDCSYDDSAFLTKEIDFSCTLDSQSNCYGVIFYNQSLLSVSPKFKDVKNYGLIDYIESDNLLLNIKYKTKDLFPDIPYNFSVFCSNNQSIELFSTIITPTYRTPREISYQGIFIKENLGFVIAGVIFIIIIIMFIYFVISISRGGRR